MDIKWRQLKNERLKRVRNISFEEIVLAEVVDIRFEPDRQKSFFLVWHKGHVWVVPFAIKQDDIHLTTAYPSRKYTQIYAKGV